MTTREATLDLYYPLVTEAIRRAEALEDLGAPGASAAYLDVSRIEETIAEKLPTTDPEGALARRGAVRAAFAADEPERGRELVERYLAEAEASEELKAALSRLQEEAEEPSRRRFPHVAETYGMSEIRRFAAALARQAAPFPIG
jgi:hypothetical protein